MALPTFTDVRTFLEGYGIDVAILTDAWITARMTNSIKPIVERVIRRPVEGTEEITEYLSGNGKSLLRLSKKPINSVTSLEYVTGGDYNSTIGLGGVEVIEKEGLLKSIANITEGGYNIIFAKGERNIKVIYNVGWTTIEPEIKEAMIMLASEQILGFVGARTGGGSISIQGFGRTFGNRGKWQDIRDDLKRQAWALLQPYMTSIVGNVR